MDIKTLDIHPKTFHKAFINHMKLLTLSIQKKEVIKDELFNFS